MYFWSLFDQSRERFKMFFLLLLRLVMRCSLDLLEGCKFSESLFRGGVHLWVSPW